MCVSRLASTVSCCSFIGVRVVKRDRKPRQDFVVLCVRQVVKRATDQRKKLLRPFTGLQQVHPTAQLGICSKCGGAEGRRHLTD